MGNYLSIIKNISFNLNRFSNSPSLPPNSTNKTVNPVVLNIVGLSDLHTLKIAYHF